MMALLGAHSLCCEMQAASMVTEAPSLVCSSLGWRGSRLGVGQGQAGCWVPSPTSSLRPPHPSPRCTSSFLWDVRGVVKWG